MQRVSKLYQMLNDIEIRPMIPRRSQAIPNSIEQKCQGFGYNFSNSMDCHFPHIYSCYLN